MKCQLDSTAEHKAEFPEETLQEGRVFADDSDEDSQDSDAEAVQRIEAKLKSRSQAEGNSDRPVGLLSRHDEGILVYSWPKNVNWRHKR